MALDVAVGVTGDPFSTIRNHISRGDIKSAARVYEHSGRALAQRLIDESSLMDQRSRKALGEMFAVARDFAHAARLFDSAGLLADAAPHYERAGEFVNAARCYQLEGNLLKAAAGFERAGHITEALDLYDKSGNREAVAECLARQEKFHQAAKVYQDLGNVHAEVEMLRLVPNAEPARVPAVKRLAELMERYGQPAMAADVLMGALQQCPHAAADGDLPAMTLRALDLAGRHDDAQRLRAHFNSHGHVSASPTQASVLTRSETEFDPFAGSDVVDSAAAYDHLKTIPLFSELSLEDMQDLYRTCVGVCYGPGHLLIEQGTRGPGLIIVMQGEVEVQRVEEAGVKVLAKLAPGAFVGEMSLMDDAPTGARVVARNPVHALYIQRERFEQFLYTHENAALRIYRIFTRILSERLRAANKRA